MATVIDIDTHRLGRDVAIPDDPDDDLTITVTGDLAVVAGRPNLAGALRRRLLTPPGSMVHRPTYGAGTMEFLEGPGTPGAHALLAAGVRRQVLRDPRLSEARARVRAGVPAEGEPTDATVIALSYRVRNDTQDELVAVLME